MWSDGERAVVLVDLPAFGRPVRLVWHKRRWRCPRDGCEAGSVTEQAAEIAPPRALLTSRAARWATRQAGRGRPLKDVAAELGCVWHTVNTAVKRWGQALLAADTARISDVEALGLDETLFWRRGRFRAKTWGTSIVDVGRGQLLDIVRGRDAKAPTRWLLRRRREWRDGIRWAVLDLSGPAGAGNSVAVVDLPRCAPMLSPRVVYIDHLNTHRPHRSLDQRPPVATDPPDQPDRHLQVVEAARCNGLINEYRNAA